MGWKEVKRMKKVQIDPATQQRNPSRKQLRNAKIKQKLTQQVEVQVIPALEDMEGYEKRKPRVCAYCRVSTDMDTQALSYELQVQNYTEYITGNPDWAVQKPICCKMFRRRRMPPSRQRQRWIDSQH